MTAGEVKALVHAAFVTAIYPGDDAPVRSAGDEPEEVLQLFRGRTDWRQLASEFVDRAGAASPSALSFFSNEAFRFYLKFNRTDLQGLPPKKPGPLWPICAREAQTARLPAMSAAVSRRRSIRTGSRELEILSTEAISDTPSVDRIV
jgi:hypothetical protein